MPKFWWSTRRQLYTESNTGGAKLVRKGTKCSTERKKKIDTPLKATLNLQIGHAAAAERRTPTVRRATPLRTAAFFLFAVTPDPLLTNAPRKPNTHSSTSDTSSNRCVLSFGGNARPSAHERTDSLLSHAASPSPLRHAPRRLFFAPRSSNNTQKRNRARHALSTQFDDDSKPKQKISAQSSWNVFPQSS